MLAQITTACGFTTNWRDIQIGNGRASKSGVYMQNCATINNQLKNHDNLYVGFVESP